MTQEEAVKFALEYPEEMQDTVYDTWMKNPGLTKTALANMFPKDPAGKIAAAEAKTRDPLTEAFGVSDSKIGALLNPNSDLFWQKSFSSKELLDIAKKAGYVDELPADASEEEKQANREKFGKFLGYLTDVSNYYGKRNAVAEYEKTKFLDDPIGWGQKQINHFLFGPFEKRMLEKAMRGEGPSGWLDMDAGDWGTLGTDIAANTMYGAGGKALSTAGGALSKSLLESYLRKYGSAAAAGAIAGAAKAANRDLGTEEGARWYEYPSEALLGAGFNAVGAEMIARQAARRAARAAGNVKIVRDKLKPLRNMGNEAEQKLDAALDRAEDAVVSRNKDFVPYKTAEQIVDDMNTVDFGISDPRLRDEIMSLWQAEGGKFTEEGFNSAISAARYNNDAEMVNFLSAAQRLNGAGKFELDVLLSGGRFKHIGTDPMKSELYGDAAFNTSRNGENIKQLQKSLFDDMSPEDALRSNRYELHPSTVDQPVRPYGGTKTAGESLSEMKKLIEKLIKEDPGKGLESQRVRELLEQYPELKDWYRTLAENPASRSKKFLDFGANSWKTSPGRASVDVLRSVADNALVKTKDIKETGDDVTERKFEELSKRKPDAVRAAMGWLTDYDLPTVKRLNPEERKVIDDWRLLQMKRNLLGN